MGVYVIGSLIMATLYRQEGRKGWAWIYTAIAIAALAAQAILEVL
jgi:hypothetical protein